MCRSLAIRSLWKRPAFALVAVVSLAAGIGLSTALFAIADAILFRPLPVPHPERIVRIFTASAAQRFGFTSYPDFDDLRSASTTFDAVAHSQILIAISTQQGVAPQVRLGLAVTPDYFDVLRVRPALGRSFRSEEARRAVVMLAYSFWQTQFASDRAITGKIVLLGASPFTVIGVAPENFALDRFAREDFYVPMHVYEAGLLPSTGNPLADRSRRYLSVFARLRPGATLALARAEAAAMGDRLAAAHPQSNRGRRMIAMTELAARLESDRTMPELAALLGGAAAMVFLTACVNVAGLLMLHAEARAGDIAVQVALGATRARLLADSLLASATVAASGALVAIPLAWAAVRAAARAAMLPTDLPLAISARIDGRMIAILVAASAIAALICGSLRVRRGRDVLIAVEVAFASALAASGFSLLSAIRSAARVDPGFRTEHVLTMALDPAQVRYGEIQSRAFYSRALDRVRAVAGVRAVALAQSAPLGFTGAQRQIEIAGEQESSTVWINIVTPEYFDLMRIPVRGRIFDARETAASPPVAIVNVELARRCKLGERFRMNGRMVEVVGVASTVKYFSIGDAPRPFLYLPFSQNYASRMFLHVETAGDPASAVHAIVGRIHELDAAQPVSEIRPARDYLTRGATFQARVALDAVAAVAVCGVALALAGLYAALAQWTIARRREIGIRIALGAQRRAIAMMVAARGLRIAGVGACVGVAIAWADARSMIAAAAIVMALSAAASVIPAMRAASVDPAQCLRKE